ncbi:hypothetical protein PG993_013056 [Apiospora rasikravindrae]|uniref:Uncharacterized protein n=1 Tax=Apiospora rasikravindrae TaxID=990691 RepID=A0ABR1RWJ7_9PEZI
MILLLEDFPKLEVMYFHAQVPLFGSRGAGGYSRNTMVQGLDSRDCPEVLLSTFDISSAGLNLQAAIWLTMVEEPNNSTDKE